MDFSTLKKKSQKSNNINKLVEEMNKDTKKSYIDERFWTPTTDDRTGNGTAVIRFLPSSADNNLPWVKYYSHGFKGPGGWYIENSRTTIGEADPVSEANTALWDTGIDANKTIVRQRKRKENYVANILVVDDPAKPENNGKLFLYRFGPKIFGKIKEQIQPEFDDQAPVDIFDFWKGKNFRLRIKTVDKFPNYDSSFFEEASPLLEGDDDKLKALWESQYNLREFTDPKNFKSYDELKKRFDKVVGNKPPVASTKGFSQPEAPAEPQAVKYATTQPSVDEDDDVPWSNDDEDDDSKLLEYFQDLADED